MTSAIDGLEVMGTAGDGEMAGADVKQPSAATQRPTSVWSQTPADVAPTVGAAPEPGASGQSRETDATASTDGAMRDSANVASTIPANIRAIGALAMVVTTAPSFTLVRYRSGVSRFMRDC